ncbi:MAG: hypothetical protein QM539_01965 [Alphaproteobacteria bacterium]|nr:hypothetical protein [Alphaproteobacteria bacterium]
MVKYYPKKEISLTYLWSDSDDTIKQEVFNKMLPHVTKYRKIIQSLINDALTQHGKSNLIKLDKELMYHETLNSLKKWAKQKSPSLTEGIFYLDSLVFPNLNWIAYQSKINFLLKEVWIELTPNLTNVELAIVIQTLFKKHFRLNTHNPEQKVEDFTFHHWLETQHGSPAVAIILLHIISDVLKLPAKVIHCKGQTNFLAFYPRAFLDAPITNFIPENICFVMSAKEFELIPIDDIKSYIDDAQLYHQNNYTIKNSKQVLANLVEWIIEFLATSSHPNQTHILNTYLKVKKYLN